MTEIRANDTWYENDVSIGADASESRNLDVYGADKISGIVDRANAYQVDIEWLDPSGNVVITENIVSSGATGQSEISEDVHFPNCNLVVTDTSSSSDTADIVVNMR